MTLLVDWLTREGSIIFGWWLWITLAGFAVFPLCIRLLGGLPDKGYTLSRAIGMLLVTFVFWSLGSYGFLDNSVGSIILAWVIVVAIALTAYVRLGNLRDIVVWWRENRTLVIVTEVIFIALFFCWTFFRAYQNEILYTEKPMELAFMSAVQRSDTFPPNDPWMSGYAISYYYMGYVMTSMLSMLTGITSTIGFNLTIASQFALTGVTAFGVAYNLVRSRAFEQAEHLRDTTVSRFSSLAIGVLGMIFVVLLGNFQGFFIEAPYQSNSLPASYFEFWGTQERANFADGAYLYQPDAPLVKDPAQWNSWWWFRASRVLTDYQLDDTLPPSFHAQPIDEFPAFSFLLADNHPHVLALPFVMMVIGLMLNLLLTHRDPNRFEMVLYGIAVGGLVFLNTWDGPIYLVGLVGTDALRRIRQYDKGRLQAHDWIELIRFGFILFGITLIAYLPFIIGFRSQASGILPNLIHPTAFRRLFIMFGPFIIILSAFLAVEAWRGVKSKEMNWRLGLSIGGLGVLGLFVLLISLTLISILLPSVNSYVQSFITEWGGLSSILPLLARRRVLYGLTTLLLTITVIIVVARIFPKVRKSKFEVDEDMINITYPAATGFALLLIGMGALLVLMPEFFYLRDNFSTRINTIFKFYYQAWAVFSIAGAYAVYSILGERQLPRVVLPMRVLFGGALVFVLVAGLMYSIFGVYHRVWVETGRNVVRPNRQYTIPEDWANPVIHVANGVHVQVGALLISEFSLVDNPQTEIIQSAYQGIVSIRDNTIEIIVPMTLDGGSTMIDRNDFAVVSCLSALVEGDDAVIVEAVRDAYNAQYGRVGALTGIPILLGWENHERQWRGASYDSIAGTRRQDIERLYTDVRWDTTLPILERYEIDYILYGTTERAQYGSVAEEKFMNYLPVVCQSGDSRVFYVDRTADLSEFR